MKVSVIISVLLGLVLTLASGLWRKSVFAAIVVTVGVAFATWLWVSQFTDWVWATIRLNREARRIRRIAEGQCVSCGYDMRATPERCPECGAHTESEDRASDDPGDPPTTPAVNRVLRAAAGEAAALGDDHVGTEHVLLAVLNEEAAAGREILEHLGVDRQAVLDAVAASRQAEGQEPTRAPAGTAPADDTSAPS